MNARLVEGPSFVPSTANASSKPRCRSSSAAGAVDQARLGVLPRGHPAHRWIVDAPRRTGSGKDGAARRCRPRSRGRRDAGAVHRGCAVPGADRLRRAAATADVHTREPVGGNGRCRPRRGPGFQAWAGSRTRHGRRGRGLPGRRPVPGSAHPAGAGRRALAGPGQCRRAGAGGASTAGQRPRDRDRLCDPDRRRELLRPQRASTARTGSAQRGRVGGAAPPSLPGAGSAGPTSTDGRRRRQSPRAAGAPRRAHRFPADRRASPAEAHSAHTAPPGHVRLPDHHLARRHAAPLARGGPGRQRQPDDRAPGGRRAMSHEAPRPGGACPVDPRGRDDRPARIPALADALRGGGPVDQRSAARRAPRTRGGLGRRSRAAGLAPGAGRGGTRRTARGVARGGRRGRCAARRRAERGCGAGAFRRAEPGRGRTSPAAGEGGVRRREPDRRRTRCATAARRRPAGRPRRGLPRRRGGRRAVPAQQPRRRRHRPPPAERHHRTTARAVRPRRRHPVRGTVHPC